MPAFYANEIPSSFPGFQPAELRRQGAVLTMTVNRGCLDPDHILNGQLQGSQNVIKKRLKSKRPFEPASRKILGRLSELCIRVAQSTNT